MSIDDLIQTREGLALADVAWEEGAAAVRRAVLDADRTGTFRDPQSPYSAPLLRMIREGKS